MKGYIAVCPNKGDMNLKGASLRPLLVGNMGISPQCVEVFPALLPMPPRDARSRGEGAATSHKLASLGYDREGVVRSPLGGEWIKC